ncbi:MAG: hypothetical protein WB952_12095 [Terriglobales bacterium]
MTLAVYTTIYPGVEPYLPDWHRSLCEQTDQEFQLWIGLDKLSMISVKTTVGSNLKANWVVADSGCTPAQIRQKVLSQIVETCSQVVLVDSDDLLHPSRVAAARESLKHSELAGCALRLVDQQGEDLGLTFGLPQQLEPENIFPRNNVFGLSNSAFRSDLLRRCLPIPASTILVDWFLATRAWLLGARLAFDPMPRMDYRQHPTNTARVRLPFSRDQVVSDTALVRQHFQLVLAEPPRNLVAHRYDALMATTSEVEKFHQQIVLCPRKLDAYVEALNALHPALIWWTSVAYPTLGDMWS